MGVWVCKELGVRYLSLCMRAYGDMLIIILVFFFTALVCESPMTVQLHFEPAGRPGVDREYYLHEKENICVVCGTDQNCVRKNIIPHEYRR